MRRCALADDLMDSKLVDLRKSLYRHICKHIVLEFKDIFSCKKRNIFTLLVFIILNLCSGYLFYLGLDNKDIIRLIVAESSFGTQFYLALFGILLSVFAIFQALQAPKFVKYMHDVGKQGNSHLDPLYELGLQFLSMTILSLFGYLYSLCLEIITTGFVREYIVIGHFINTFAYPMLLFVVGIIFSLYSIVFLFDLISMVYNLWKTLSIFTVKGMISGSSNNDNV